MKNLFLLLALLTLVTVTGFTVFLFHSKQNSSDVLTLPHLVVRRYIRFSRKIMGHIWVTETLENHQNSTATPAAENKSVELCPDTSPKLLGPFEVEFETDRTLEDVRQQVGSLLQHGGHYKPSDCISKQKVAVIVPFRNRHQHLVHWLYYLHPMLMRQQLDYGVYVINQDGDGVFNRAKLMNIGHVEALKEYDYDCFVFSDVDLVPLDDRNLYRCFDKPRHLSVAIDKFNYVPMSPSAFGGVSSLTKEQFSQVNGFSNSFWGWGGEDDDLYNRIMLRIKSVSRSDNNVARYKMIKHGRDLHNEVNLKNADMVHETQKTLDQDGLNSLNYTVQEIMKDQLFTFITVDVHVPPV